MFWVQLCVIYIRNYLSRRFFFFQAEDGIRYLVRSRGLGDVYKRQNIHTNVMVDYEERGAIRRSDAAVDELFRQVVAWGGSITGEHGIGLAKKSWWRLAASKELRDLHQTVKDALDPHGILNPGKFL